MPDCCMDAEKLAVAASTLAVALSKDKSCAEIAMTAKFLHTVAQNMTLILDQKVFCGECKK